MVRDAHSACTCCSVCTGLIAVLLHDVLGVAAGAVAGHRQRLGRCSVGGWQRCHGDHSVLDARRFLEISQFGLFITLSVHSRLTLVIVMDYDHRALQLMIGVKHNTVMRQLRSMSMKRERERETETETETETDRQTDRHRHRHRQTEKREEIRN